MDPIIDVIYNHELFPKIFTSYNNDAITKDDLNIDNFFVEAYRNSNVKITLDYERFNQTLKNILLDKNIDNLLQIRAIILIIMLKNCIDATTIFEILLDEDSNLFNSNSLIFNDIFFNELSKNPLLVKDLVEIIKSFIKKNSLDNEAIYPIIYKIILANENSKTPVDSNQLIFMDESDIKLRHKKNIQKSYPMILPFKLKYEEYLNYDAPKTTFYINVNRNNVLDSVWLLDDVNIFNF